MTKGYYVVQSTPGYMPDWCLRCRNKADAVTLARDLAKQYREAEEDGVPLYKVRGNVKDGYRITRWPPTDTDLGLVIEVQVAEDDGEEVEE